VLQLPFNISHLRVKLILFSCLSSIQVFIGHTLCIMRIAYLRRSGLEKSIKEAWTIILSKLHRLYHKPTNPDKSRPCLTHRRLQLILSDWFLFECGRFVKLSEQSKRLLIFPTKIIPPPCAQRPRAVYSHRQYLNAKVQK